MRVGGAIWRFLGAMTGTPLGLRARTRGGRARRPALWLREASIVRRLTARRWVNDDGLNGTHTECRGKRRCHKQAQLQRNKRHCNAGGGMSEGEQSEESGKKFSCW